MRQVKAAEKRVAMSYEFEDLLNQLHSKKEESQHQTDEQRVRKLGQILSRSVDTFELRISGNQTTKSEFIAKELNVRTPNDIESCSVQIFDGINVESIRSLKFPFNSQFALCIIPMLISTPKMDSDSAMNSIYWTLPMR